MDQRDRLATLILTDISLPLLDICAAVETDPMSDSEALNKFSKKLVERSHEIRFQVILVKHYIAGMDRLQLMPQESIFKSGADLEFMSTV